MRQSVDSATWCLACLCGSLALLTPPIVWVLVEGSAPAAGKHELLRTNPRQTSAAAKYLDFHHAEADGPFVKPAVLFNVSDEQACARHCDVAPNCVAFSYSPERRSCKRQAGISAVRAASGTSCGLRRGASWPLLPPERQRWRHNATLVLGWSGGDVSWLRRLPLDALDVAVISVGGAPSSAGDPKKQQKQQQHGSRARRSRRESVSSTSPSNATTRDHGGVAARSVAAAAAAAVVSTRPRGLLQLEHHLSYYAELPHSPRAPSRPHRGSGSQRDQHRDAPAAAASALAAAYFIREFYHNLPPLIIVADERCGQRENSGSSRSGGGAAADASACSWVTALGATAVRARLAITRALEASLSMSAPSEASCLCQLASSGPMRSRHAAYSRGVSSLIDVVEPRAARWFGAQFMGGAAPRDALRRLPSDGSLAVSAERIRSRPLATYAALLQMLLVDYKYPGVSAFSWGLVAQERWLDLLYAGAAATRTAASLFMLGGEAATTARMALGGLSDGAISAGVGLGGRLGGRTGSQLGGLASELGQPYDPCFESSSACGADASTTRLRAHLRAKSAQLMNSVRSSVYSMEERLVSAKQRATQALPALPALPSMPAGVRGWWRTARKDA